MAKRNAKIPEHIECPRQRRYPNPSVEGMPSTSIQRPQPKVMPGTTPPDFLYEIPKAKTRGK